MPHKLSRTKRMNREPRGSSSSVEIMRPLARRIMAEDGVASTSMKIKNLNLN